MKKLIAIIIILCTFFLVSDMAYADSLSTSKTIRLTLKVVSESEIEGSDETINTGSIDEKKKLEAPPSFIRNVSQNYKDSPFFKIIRVIIDVFK